MADTRALEWRKRADKAFDEASNYHALCQALAEIYYPERASFFADNLVGDEYYRDIYDGYPVLMRWRLGNSLGAMTRGRGQEWFKAVAWPPHLNEDDEVAFINEDDTKTLRALVYRPQAQFSPRMSISDQDYACFGSSCVKGTENPRRDGVLFQVPHLKSLALEENAVGEVDVTHERLDVLGRQFLQMFGDGKDIPRALKEAAKKNPLEKLPVHQCVFPVTEYEPSKARRPPRGAEFVSLYIDPESEKVLREEYFYSFPYIWRRWMRSVSGSPYGYSPCALVGLADAHMSQEARRSLIEAVNYAADPARVIDAAALEGSLDLSPSGVNYTRRQYNFRNGQPVMAIDGGTIPQWGFEFAKDGREFQGQSWLINLLTLPENRSKTAFEAERLLDQDAREASPIFEPMEADNARLLQRVYSIGQRWGAFLPRPDKLKRAERGYEFETPVSAALRRTRAQQGLQVVGVVGQFASTEMQFGQSEAYRRVNWKRLMTDVVRGIGPADWIRSEDEAAPEIQADKAEKDLAKALAFGQSVAALGAAGGGGGAPLSLPAPDAPADAAVV